MHFDLIDAGLEGMLQFANKGYFFRGNGYVRYDWKLDREDFGYPKPISLWKLPQNFASGIDAACNGQGPFLGKAYFFKGNTYARYDWARDEVDEIDRDIAAWKLPASFLSGVDAALTGEGQFSGKTYFFKGDQYVRYDWGSDSTSPPSSIAVWQFPDEFGAGIDAAINGRGPFTGKAYVFRGTEYARYDWSADAPDDGYPHLIAGDWKHGVTIWAENDTPTNVERDSRLREDDGSTLSRLPYPQGTTRGQAGWDVGLQFGSLKSLASKLRFQPIALPNFICGNLFQDCEQLKPGQISRLGINAHGNPGEVAINGRNNPVRLNVTTLATDPDLQRDLEGLRDATDPSATILFEGCLAGRSLGGTALLTALSQFMPGRKIVGFSTVQFSHGGLQSRKGALGFSEPGVRDTAFTINASSEAEEDARHLPIWNDLNALPWASEFSPHAKVALNGVIIRGANL